MVVERDRCQRHARLLAAFTQCLLRAFPLSAKALGITVKIQSTTNDLSAFKGRGVTAEGNVQAESIKQLRTQLAFFRVHGADQHEARRMPMGNAVTLDQVGAAGRHVEQQVHQMVGQQIHFVDVQHAAVGLG
ncbi:hypothetical protein D3C78_1398840 [compost metagenome]